MVIFVEAFLTRFIEQQCSFPLIQILGRRYEYDGHANIFNKSKNISPIGYIKFPIGDIYLFVEWGFLSNHNRAWENKSPTPKGWYPRASLGPKSIVTISEISLTMHSSFESKMAKDNSPQSSYSGFWNSTMQCGRLVLLNLQKEDLSWFVPRVSCRYELLGEISTIGDMISPIKDNLPNLGIYFVVF